MSNLSIFSKTSDWPHLLETVSGVLGVSGSNDSDDSGRRYVWEIFGIQIVAIDNPKLEDDQGIPFSEFNSEIDLILSNTEPLQEVETFLHAFAVLFVLRLRKYLDPDIRFDTKSAEGNPY